MELLSINKLIIDSIIEYGKEVNLNRHIPYIYDGLKPSYRKVILSALDINNDNFIKTSKIIADTSKYTTHGTDLLKDVVSTLVRWNILEGQGIIGLIKALDKELGDASPRYTEVRVNKQFKNEIKELLPLVNCTKNELNNLEPDYIPTPIPILSQYGSIGIGIGCRCIIPSFTKKSMLDAYLNNDPNRLVFNYDYKLLEGNLRDIWESSSARYKLTFPYHETENEIIVYGNPELFKINFKIINKLINDGQLQMINLSHKGKNKLLFKRQPKAKKLSVLEMKKIIKSSISQIINFNILVHDGNYVYKTSLKDWIDITYNNYIRLLKRANEVKINKLKFLIEINNNLVKVAQILFNNLNNKISYEDIAKQLNIDINIVETIGNKPINFLMNCNKEVNNESLINQINKLKEFNYVEHINTLINDR